MLSGALLNSVNKNTILTPESSIDIGHHHPNSPPYQLSTISGGGHANLNLNSLDDDFETLDRGATQEALTLEQPIIHKQPTTDIPTLSERSPMKAMSNTERYKPPGGKTKASYIRDEDDYEDDGF